MLDKAAEAIRKRGLETPAIMALELHKPLANVGANALVVFAPFAVPFFGFDGVRDASRLLRKRGKVEKLIQRLECTERWESSIGTPDGSESRSRSS